MNAEPALGPKDWYQVYVNPFILLDAAPADVIEVKALQSARKQVLLEVDVGEGRLEWLPGLVVDKSSVLTRIAVLENPAARKVHERVYEDAALCAFLSRGHLDYFLREGTAELVSLEPRESLTILGPVFAAQFNRLFMRAVEARDMAVVECMLCGRRWVLPEQEEQCFEGGKRALEKLVSSLGILAKTADERLVGKEEIKRELDRNALLHFVDLLPSEFYETHGAVGCTLRQLSVSFYNKATDVREALAILKLAGPCAAKSPALAEQLAEDEQTLNDLLVREQAKEAHMTVGGQTVSITRTGITHGAVTLAADNVSGIAFGQVIVSRQPQTVRHAIRSRPETERRYL